MAFKIDYYYKGSLLVTSWKCSKIVVFLSTYIYLLVANITLPRNHLDNLALTFICVGVDKITHTQCYVLFMKSILSTLFKAKFFLRFISSLYCISFETEKQNIFLLFYFFLKFEKMIKSRKIFSFWFHLHKKVWFLKLDQIWNTFWDSTNFIKIDMGKKDWV